jgi:hypothetical protein
VGVVRTQLMNWTGGGHKYKLTFRVQVDDPWFGPLAIENYFRNELGIRRGVAYSYGNGETMEADPISFAGAPEITPFDSNRLNWQFAIEYSDTEEDEEEENPLEQPAQFSRFAQSREEAFERDVHGRPIRNTAFDRYDEVLTRDTHRTVLRVVKNFATWPQDNYRFMNTVNRLQTRVSGRLYEPRTIRLINMRDSIKYSEVLKTDANPRGEYSEAELEFAFAEDDWEIVILDQGLRQAFRRWRVSHTRNASTTEEMWSVIRAETEELARQIADRQFVFGWSFIQEIAPGLEPCRVEPPREAGQPATGAETRLPMLLDGAGRQQHANGTPVWNRYQGYFDVDFAVFGLG